jgi:anti-sigma-K factor RskA
VSTNHDLYLDLCAALALGSIDPADRRVLEEHLAGGCAGCHALLQDLSAPLEALARSVDPVKPSRGLKARTMVAVAQAARGQGSEPRAAGRTSPAPARTGVPGWVWIALAVLVAVAALGWWRVSVLDEVQEEIPARHDEVERDLWLDRFNAFRDLGPQVKRIELERRPDAPPGLRVEVLYDTVGRRAAVRVLAGSAPAGEVLELWTLRDNKPYSEGLMLGAIVFIENTGDPKLLSGFAVSTEPPQGAQNRQTPTKLAMFGKVS